MAVVTCRSCGRCNLADELTAAAFSCELCGQIIPVSDRPPESASTSAAPLGPGQQEARPRLKAELPTSSWDLFDWYRAVKWVAGGVFCIGIGIWLMTSPTFRDNPKELTLSDAMPGIGAIVVGCVMLALLVIGLYRR